MKILRTSSCLLLVFLLFIAMIMVSCQMGEGKFIRGEGEVVEQKGYLEHFNSLEIKGMFDVELHHGDTLYAIVLTDSNLQDLVQVYVAENVLHISTHGETILKPSRLKIRVSYNQLKSVVIEGACNLRATGPVLADTFKMMVSGAADVNLELRASHLQTHIAGAGDLTLSGEAVMHSVSLSGASRLKAQELITAKTRIDMAGAGSVEVYASQQIDVNLSGVGMVTYHGNPAVRNLNISGLGKIEEAVRQ